MQRPRTEGSRGRQLLALLWTTAALGMTSCTEQETSADASPPDGASAADGGAPDARAPDTSAPAFDECSSDCASTAAQASFGDVRETFDSAQFGFDGDGRIRIELHGEAPPGCPTMSSPTPARTLVIHGMHAPSDRTPQSESLALTLFDFEGTLTDEPLLRAESATVMPTAALLSPPADAFVAFDVEATFPGGTIAGHGYATHCESLDAS